tara:strand:+ start:822 stop:1070 length:249 start_codon:yes stop_codon:yes gene_type:complete
MDYNELENSFEFLDNLEEMRTTVREMEELRKSIIQVELTDLNSQALRSQMLQTVNGSLMNFKTLLKISEMVVSRVKDELEDE